MLTRHEIEIVQRDWAKVELMGEAAATLLYDRLFSLDPAARSLFPSDLSQQKLKLIRMLGSAIHGLSNPELLLPIIQYLGRKHERLGVQNYQYDTVGQALLWTLKLSLGDEFDQEHEAAWVRVYGVLAETMQKAP
jgi:hemoglobin-like flavoprotein